jgi:hypothetical protein
VRAAGDDGQRHDTLKALGVPRNRIISERFDLAEGNGLTQTLRARLLHIGLASAFAGVALAFGTAAQAPIGHESGHGFLIDKHMKAGLICESCPYRGFALRCARYGRVRRLSRRLFADRR